MCSLEALVKVVSGNLLPQLGTFQIGFRDMEPPYLSIQPENPDKVKLKLIRSDFSVAH